MAHTIHTISTIPSLYASATWQIGDGGWERGNIKADTESVGSGPWFPTFPPAMPFLSLAERALAPRHPQAELVSGQGNFLIGVFVGILLYGVSFHQAYRYVRNFQSDAGYIRLLVILVMLLETLHVLTNMHASFYYLVSNYSNVKALRHFVWSSAVTPAIGAAIVLVSQIFFIRRVSLIGPHQRVMAIVVAISLVAGLGFATAAAIISFSDINGKLGTVSLLSGASLVVAGFADTALTIALFRAFRAERAAEPRDSESIIDVIQLYVVNSGVATGTFNLISFILAVSQPFGSVNLLYSAFAVISVRLYANSLLAVLNSRELRGMEFLLSSSSSPIMVEGAQFADRSALWNVPRVRPPQLLQRVQAAALRGEDGSQISDPWIPVSEGTKKLGYGRYYGGYEG